MRKALGIRNWESAQKIVRDMEARNEAGVFVIEAFGHFLADCEARKLSPETTYKYRALQREMVKAFGTRLVDSLEVQHLANFRQSWKLGANTARNKIELMRRFFSFCVQRGWCPKNPAKYLELPKNNNIPTLPVEDDDFEKLVAACSRFPRNGIYGGETGKRVKAFLLLLRYSGLRIRDAVLLKPASIVDDKLFVYSHKTHVPVWLPLPKFVLNELELFSDGEYFFWSGIGTAKSGVAAWQRSLKTLGKYAGVTFHPHQLRNSFAISLLKKGVPLETVAVLLGNSVKVAERHYSPHIPARQLILEEAVRRTF